MAKKKKTYKRLQFDFSEKSVESIDDLVDATDSKTRAEVVRKALSVYEKLNGYLDEGWQIELTKGEERISVLPLPI